MKRKLSGEVVVFSSLLFILVITFSISVMDAASLEMAKSYRRCDMNRAAECVFAEFQQEMLEHYDVFAMDASYETGTYKAANITKRLKEYGVSETENSLKRVQFLTDHGCRPFVEQAVLYMKTKYGLDSFESIGKDKWKSEEEKAGAYQQEENQILNQIESALSQEEVSLSEEANPIQYLSVLKSKPILELVMPKGKEVSKKSLTSSGLLSSRSLNKGKGDFSEEEISLGTVENMLFGEYVLDHYSCFTDPSHGNEKIETEEGSKATLDYEIEYLLSGKLKDTENLEDVVRKLVKLRFVPNYTYIQTDAEKRAEAEAMAATLSTIVLSPQLTELVAQGILLAWAYGESIMDVRSLLKGHSVPNIKTWDSWQLSLSSLLKLGTEEDHGDGKNTKGGMKYKDYLRVLLNLKSVETLGGRALCIAEQNMRKEYGLNWFRADYCVERIEFSSTSSFRRGIRYKYKTYFGYQ